MNQPQLKPLSEMARLAMEVVLLAPMRQSKYSRSASIPWRLVNQMREQCDRAGIDWKKLHKEARE